MNEEFYFELQKGIVERFQSLPVEDKNVMRIVHGNNEKYASILRHVLGDNIMSGLPRMHREVE